MSIIGGAAIQEGLVIGHQADAHSVMVLLKSGQGLSLPVQMLSHGPSDALRFHGKPLPSIGSKVAIAFLGSDNRNGVILGSFRGNQADAINSAPDDWNTTYDSEDSGFYHFRDGNGQSIHSHPDGTNFIVGFNGVEPTTYRHTVVNNVRTRTVFTRAQRVPNPKPAMPVTLRHASGTVVQTAANGDQIINSVGNVSITATGNITAIAGSGQTLNLIANGATITIDASGNLNLFAASGGNITMTGETVTILADTKLNLGAIGGKAVARIGDSVSTGGVITSGSAIVFSE